MNKFDALNRETQQYNHRNVTRPCSAEGTRSPYISISDLLARRNSETYRENNGQYPSRPYKG